MELPYLWKHLTHCKFFQCDTSTFGFIYNSSNEVNLWLQIWFFLNPREFEFDSINSQTIWLSFDLIPNSDDEGNTCHIHEFRRYIHCLDATSSLSVFFPRCKSVHSRETVSGSFCRNPIKVRTVELLNPTDFSRSDTILVTCNYSFVLMMMIAFITVRSSLVPLIEGLCAQIYFRFEISVVCVHIFCFSFSEEEIC